MFLVQVRSWAETNEELRSICVRASVSHRQNTLVSMRIPNLFILKLLSVNTLTTGSVLICGISSLSHKSFNNPVEDDVLIVIWWTFFAHTDLSEIFSCFWDLLCEQFKYYSSFFSIFNLNVKECLCIFWIKIWKFAQLFWRNFNDLFVVNTLRKKFSHGTSLRLRMLFLL